MNLSFTCQCFPPRRSVESGNALFTSTAQFLDVYNALASAKLADSFDSFCVFRLSVNWYFYKILRTVLYTRQY